MNDISGLFDPVLSTFQYNDIADLPRNLPAISDIITDSPTGEQISYDEIDDEIDDGFDEDFRRL
ncbi:MAG: hypothetical protein ACRD8Z_17115 [Nitrososphaeraceae archaeon]